MSHVLTLMEGFRSFTTLLVAEMEAVLAPLSRLGEATLPLIEVSTQRLS